MTEAKLLKQVAEIRKIVAKCNKWTSENEDICGYDDATWFDTIHEFDEQLGEAGIALADAVEAFFAKDKP